MAGCGDGTIYMWSAENICQRAKAAGAAAAAASAGGTGVNGCGALGVGGLETALSSDDSSLTRGEAGVEVVGGEGEGVGGKVGAGDDAGVLRFVLICIFVAYMCTYIHHCSSPVVSCSSAVVSCSSAEPTHNSPTTSPTPTHNSPTTQACPHNHQRIQRLPPRRHATTRRLPCCSNHPHLHPSRGVYKVDLQG